MGRVTALRRVSRPDKWELSRRKGKPVKPVSRIALAATLLVLVSACSSPAASPGASQASPGASAAKPLVEVTMALSSATDISLSVPLVAEQAGYFAEEGIKIKSFVDGGGGPNTATLVSSGQVQAGAHVIDSVYRLAAQGQSLPIVVPLSTLVGQQFVLNKDLATKLGITPEMSNVEKFKKLKGTKLGISSPGSSTDASTRYLFKKAGLNPDTDVKLVALGTVAGILSAFRSGQIDGFIVSPPTPRQASAPGEPGIIIVDFFKGQVPEFTNIIWQVETLNKDWAAQNHAAALGLTRAILRALMLIHDDPTKAANLIYQPYFAKTFDRASFDISWQDFLPAFAVASEVKIDKLTMDRVNEVYFGTLQGASANYDYKLAALPDLLTEAQASLAKK
jgi:NitT/TauT family transport system substrate-binding protein